VSQTGRRWIVAVAAVVFIGIVGYFIESERRRRLNEQPTLLGKSTEVAVDGPAELAARFSDPARFHEFCLKVNEKYLAMNVRYKSSQHRRKQRTKQVDDAGKATVDEELVALVDFPNGQERVRPISLTDRLMNQTIAADSTLQKDIASNRKTWVYAFSPEAKWDDFQYEFSGVEMVEGVPTVKVAYKPNPPFGLRIAGTVWADAETGQPIKFAGKLHQPSGTVNKYEVTAYYGIAENGKPQLRRSEIEAAGGFLVFTRRYLITIEFDEYETAK
jgi:hypothetical protein